MPAWTRGIGRSMLEGLAGGAAIGFVSALVEMLLRAAVPGGLGWEQLAPFALRAAGTLAAIGGTLGMLFGLAAEVAPGFARDATPVARGALFALAAAASGLIGFELREQLGASLRSPASMAGALALAGVIFGSAWIARRPVERLAGTLLSSRWSSPLVGLATCISLARTLPWALLREPLDMGGQSWMRATGLMAGGVAAGLVGFGLLLARSRSGAGVGLRWAAWLYAVGVIAVSLVGGFWPSAMGSGATRANVLLIVVDTLRADHLSVYGYERETSPSIAALAERGTLFTDAVSPAPFTMPSVASLLTGLLPYEHHVRVHPAPLDEDQLTLSDILRQAGWATGGVVSNPLLSRRWGFDQGFGFFDAARESPFGEAGRLALLGFFRRFQHPSRAEPTANLALRWLRRHRSDPFFLWVHFIDPHFPYAPPPPFDRAFCPDGGRYEEILEASRRGAVRNDEITGSASLPDDVLKVGIARYDGEILYTDAQIGRLVDGLHELGLAQHTLVVLTSDHGEGFGEHGVTFEHGLTTHEELMRVPLLFVWPGRVAGGVRVGAPVGTLDVAPTLLDLVGLPVPAGMRGRSLAPLLRGDPGGWQARPEYGESQPLLPGHPTYEGVARFPGIFRTGMEGKWRMVRLPPWKLIHVPGRPEGEDLLFHLDSDPAETRDRSGERSDVLAGLRVHLNVFREEERASAAVEADAGGLTKEELEKLEALGYVE